MPGTASNSLHRALGLSTQALPKSTLSLGTCGSWGMTEVEVWYLLGVASPQALPLLVRSSGHTSGNSSGPKHSGTALGWGPATCSQLHSPGLLRDLVTTGIW